MGTLYSSFQMNEMSWTLVICAVAIALLLILYDYYGGGEAQVNSKFADTVTEKQ